MIKVNQQKNKYGRRILERLQKRKKEKRRIKKKREEGMKGRVKLEGNRGKEGKKEA